MSEALLELRDFRAGYGSATILDGISLQVRANQGVALLGRNGVGKSTLLTSCMGLTQHQGGSVFWKGQNIGALTTVERAGLGLGWVPQERLVFPSLSVHEHLTAVARPGPWTLDRVYELFPSLQARKKNRGLQLSGGEQQMLALARALVTNPQLLLLDEPMEGLAPVIVQQLRAILRKLSEEGEMAMIVAEQHAKIALELTSEAVILERGRIVFSGSSRELLESPERLADMLSVSRSSQ